MFYVPRDECFSEVKQLTFSAKTVYSVFHAVVPALQTTIVDKELGFPYFSAIDQLFNEGVDLPPQEGNNLWRAILPRLLKAISDSDNALRFETPETMDHQFSLSNSHFNLLDYFNFILHDYLTDC